MPSIPQKRKEARFRPRMDSASAEPYLLHEHNLEDHEEEIWKRGTQASAVQNAMYWCLSALVIICCFSIADFAKWEYAFAFQTAGLLLLLYPVAVLIILKFVLRSRPYACFLVSGGSILMTSYMAWRMNALVVAEQLELNQGMLQILMQACQAGRPASTSLCMPSHLVSQLMNFQSDRIISIPFFVFVIVNCIQSTFVVRTGTWCTIVVAIIQCVVGGLFIMDNRHGPLSVVVGVLVGWSLHLLLLHSLSRSCNCSDKQMLYRMQQAALREQKARRASEKADSMLNHILKNIMAEAAGCIDLYLCTQGQDKLTHGTDILYRGMWWCKLREAMVSIAEGEYESRMTCVDLQEFGQIAVRGRPVMEVQGPARSVYLDLIACSIIVDNALSNAFRHGCPDDPQVKLVIKLLHPDSTVDTDADQQQPEPGPFNRRRRVQFMVTNRANSSKARLEGRWSSDGNDLRRFPHDASEAVSLSDGLGLQHIRKVANLCGMEAHLWQEHGVVYFTATIATEISEGGVGPTDTALQAIPQLPPNTRIFCIDDSAIARESMACILPSLIPDSIVRTFGENLASVEQFKAAVLEGCDIAILDQHLDYPGAEVLGTSITEYLAKAGFQGLLCIRSANSNEGDEALYCNNYAHCQIGKDMRWPAMVAKLRVEHARLTTQRAASAVSIATASDDDRRASSCGRSVWADSETSLLAGLPAPIVSPGCAGPSSPEHVHETPENPDDGPSMTSMLSIPGVVADQAQYVESVSGGSTDSLDDLESQGHVRIRHPRGSGRALGRNLSQIEDHSLGEGAASGLPPLSLVWHKDKGRPDSKRAGHVWEGSDFSDRSGR